jgi:hypothetical protein
MTEQIIIIFFMFIVPPFLNLLNKLDIIVSEQTVGISKKRAFLLYKYLPVRGMMLLSSSFQQKSQSHRSQSYRYRIGPL